MRASSLAHRQVAICSENLRSVRSEHNRSASVLWRAPSNIRATQFSDDRFRANDSLKVEG